MINAKEACKLVSEAKIESLNSIRTFLQKKQKKIDRLIRKEAKKQKSHLRFDVQHNSIISDDDIFRVYKEFYEPLGYSIFVLPSNDPNISIVKIYWGFNNE